MEGKEGRKENLRKAQRLLKLLEDNPMEKKNSETLQPTPKETGQKGPTPEKLISEWGIDTVQKRLNQLTEIERQVRGQKRKRNVTEEEAEALSKETRALIGRKKELLAVGHRQAANLTRLIQEGTYRASDSDRAERRIEKKAEDLFPDDLDEQKRFVEANLDLVSRAEYTNERLLLLLEDNPGMSLDQIKKNESKLAEVNTQLANQARQNTSLLMQAMMAHMTLLNTLTALILEQRGGTRVGTQLQWPTPPTYSDWERWAAP